jgi:ABC-type Fe3+/spermidine/putrescine transport system ATPase subunit
LNDDGSRGAMCVWAPLQADVVLMDDPLSALDSKVGRRVANEAIQVS